MHVDGVLLISEENTELPLRNVEAGLSCLAMNICGTKVMSIIDTGSRYNVIPSALVRKLNLQVTAMGSIKTLQLLNAYLIKVLGRIDMRVSINERKIIMSFVLINETFYYIILGREGRLSPD